MQAFELKQQGFQNLTASIAHDERKEKSATFARIFVSFTREKMMPGNRNSERWQHMMGDQQETRLSEMQARFPANWNFLAVRNLCS